MSEQARIWGYARVSSKEQHLDRQISCLKKFVPSENIVVDKQSGKDLDREGYQALKGILGLKRGDTLYIKSLDRLSRNKQDIKEELEWFRKNGIRLMIVDLPTSMIQVPDGQEWITEMVTNILVEVLSSMAEQERLEIRARQKEGIEAAKSRGTQFGRPRITKPVEFDTTYERVVRREITAKKAMELLGLKPNVFYKFVTEYKEGGASRGGCHSAQSGAV